ncbi:uncharacterized protein DUF4333 [Mycobacterium sp. BK558]|nr:uncharacterized protein DUF4333 [Mycobacterium sp. BK558]
MADPAPPDPSAQPGGPHRRTSDRRWHESCRGDDATAPSLVDSARGDKQPPRMPPDATTRATRGSDDEAPNTDDLSGRPGATPWWVNVNREIASPRPTSTSPARSKPNTPSGLSSGGEAPALSQPPSRVTRDPRCPVPAPQGGHRGPLGQRYPSGRSKPTTQIAVRKSSRRKHFVVFGMLVVICEVGILGFGVSRLGGSGARVLDVSRTEAAVKQILEDPLDGYGEAGVDAVTCNNGMEPTIRKGASFTCEVRIDGETRRAKVVFLDDDGVYEVDRPR